MSSRRVIALSTLLALVVIAWVWRRNASALPTSNELLAPIISKQPEIFATRTFDPNMPPAGMPPLSSGEDAECDSNFQSGASVGGESRRIDATHATLTITQVKVTLQLHVTIWVPAGVTPHVLEHEQGHRQISEYYYQTADQLASRIAASYMGKQIEYTGADLNAESEKMLQQAATDITEQYDKELTPASTQQFYDSITDHGRTDIAASDAVAAAIRNVKIATTAPVIIRANETSTMTHPYSKHLPGEHEGL